MGFAFENFDLPIVGSIVVNLSVTYHNLSVENRNPMEKESVQSDLLSKKKSPKYHPKIPFSRKEAFLDGIWDFSY